MAKADTARIEGYESMTPEQKVAALEGYEFDDHAAELERTKNALSKSNAEAADWKRKHNALLTEDEQKRQAAEEEHQAMLKELETLRREKTMASLKASYISLGYDEALAESTANAIIDGDQVTVVANQRKRQEAIEREVKAKLLGETPRPAEAPGEGGGVMTKEALRKMSPAERHKWSVEHPEEYKELYKS